MDMFWQNSDPEFVQKQWISCKIATVSHVYRTNRVPGIVLDILIPNADRWGAWLALLYPGLMHGHQSPLNDLWPHAPCLLLLLQMLIAWVICLCCALSGNGMPPSVSHSQPFLKPVWAVLYPFLSTQRRALSYELCCILFSLLACISF
jgi:hypothetical protein